MIENSFICFDTEDDTQELMKAGKDSFKKQVTQIAALTESGEAFYQKGAISVKKFKEWVLKRPEKFIYAHNLQYDLGNLFGHTLDEMDVVFVGGRIIRARWKTKEFRDTFNIWPMAVAKLGPAFGLEKMEFDAHSMEYVFRDVEIILRAMKHVWQIAQVMGLDHPPATLGGMCVKVWRNWDGTNCPCYDDLARMALYGGRVELWKTGNESGHVAYTDINSLYPFVMTKEYPGQLEPLETTAEPAFGVMECTVQVPESEICVLPWRNQEGMVMYPWGKFHGVWTVHEVRAAVARGAKVLEVNQVLGTNEHDRPYEEFVNRLYRMRLAATNDAEKLFFKLLMNNLYGRLGASGVIGRSVERSPQTEPKGVSYGSKVLVDYQMPPGEEVNWCHAAYVTSYGRLTLLDYLEKIGAPAMIYCDTDSAIFDCPNEQIPFPTGKELGQMKIEGWETHCATFAPKTYKYGEKYKAKGVPKSKAKEFCCTGRAEFDLPFKFKEAIMFFDRGNSKMLSVWRKVVRIRRSTYDRKKLVKNRYFPCRVDQG